MTSKHQTTLEQMLRDVVQRFKKSGIDTARLDARVLVGHVLGLDHAGLIAEGTRVLSVQDISAIDALVRRREQYEPVAYLIGSREFWGLPFDVSPSTLIPRPDSETLIEAVLTYVANHRGVAHPWRILDLGTGTGCLLLSLLNELPHASGLGSDIHPESVALAARNADHLQLSNRAQFVVSDWAIAIRGTFDIVISNPPYIRTGDIEGLAPDISQYEPKRALFAGEDGLDAYRALRKNIEKIAEKGTFFAFEVGHDQAEEAQNIVFSGLNFQYLGAVQDLAGKVRCILGQCTN